MVKSCLFWDTWSFPHQPIHYSRAPPNHRGCRTTRRCPWAQHRPPSPGCWSRKAHMAQVAQANMHCMGNRNPKKHQPTIVAASASTVLASACAGVSWHCWCSGAWGIGNRYIWIDPPPAAHIAPVSLFLKPSWHSPICASRLYAGALCPGFR